MSRAFSSSSTAARKAISVCSVARATYKTSTGLVGLAVDLNGRQSLLDATAQTLDALKVSHNAVMNTSIRLVCVLVP